MIRSIFLYIFLFLSSATSFSQTAFSELANTYASQGNFEEAIRLEIKSIEILENSGNVNTPEYACSSYNLGNYYYETGHYDKGLAYAIRACDLVENLKGKEDIVYALCLDNIAMLYGAKGLYNEADKYGTESLLIKEKTLGINSDEYLTSLTNLIGYKIGLGDYNKALVTCEEALTLIEQNIGCENLIYANALTNLAYIKCDIGNYVEAIKVINLALGIQKKILGENSVDYLKSLNNLSIYNFYLGDFEEAIKIEEQVLAQIKKMKNHSLYLTTLNTLSTYYAAKGHVDKAIDLLLEAINLYKIIGGNYLEYTKMLSNLAGCYYLKRNIKNAIEKGEEAVEAIRVVYGESNLTYGKFLGLLSVYYYVDERVEESYKMIENACNIIHEILGDGHPFYSKFQSFLCLYQFRSVDYESAKLSALNVSTQLINQIKSNFQYLALTERYKYWDLYKNWFNYTLPLFSIVTNDGFYNIWAYNGILLSKGILLNSEMEFDKFLAESGDEALLEKYNEIKSLRLHLNKLYEKPIAERYVDTDSLERQANELERKLMQESAEFGDYTRNLSITWEDVKDNLKDKDAAIEFAHFPLTNDNSTMYMAYVLRPNMEAPELVKLFEEKDLSKLSDNKIYKSAKVSEMIWAKLYPQLEGAENVYFAPDGVLHQIGIEYLPDYEDPNKLISDRYNLYRLSSTRQIAMKQPANLSDRAIIYGGIQYDTDPDTMKIESAKYVSTKRGYTPWYNIADSISVRSRQGYLKHTLTEAQALKALFNDNNQHPTLFIGNEASEESFKSLSGKNNNIIHIATHGFYWDEDDAEYEASKNERLLFMSQFGDNARRNVEDKALTRTGLFMAGANNALKGDTLPEDVDDGILTAQEIASLDLRGLDLVVLSACQTGMGDISGDGVFGLQRGFKKAGANTILMSLWDVNDEATQILMTEFYRNYLSGKSKQESLRLAQQYLRNYTEGEEDYSDPEFWAAFILLDGLN